MTETDKTNLAAYEQPYENKVFPLRMAGLSLTSVTLAQSATVSSWPGTASCNGHTQLEPRNAAIGSTRPKTDLDRSTLAVCFTIHGRRS
jgi:hypothetical protein